ncbi:hypothetical protein J6Z19_05940 [bacterium]|nr:hypothetical protein [bacterium]
MKNWIFVLLFAFSVFQTACSGCSKESYDYSVHCNPGTYRCQNDSSMYCNNNYEWQLNEACSGGCDKSTGKCTQPPDEEPEPDNEEENDEDIELCEIDDSFETSEYDKYFLVKSFIIDSLQSCGQLSYTPRIKTTLYDEDYPNFSVSSSDSANFDLAETLLWACDHTNFYENMHENPDENTIYVTLHSRSNISDNSSDHSDYSYFVTSHSVDAMAVITESDMNKVGNGEIADFAPVVYIFEHITAFRQGKELKFTKSCAIGMSTIVDNVPEGKFQYCMDENATIKVGQKIKVGIDASIVISPEEIEKAYAKEGLDACYCKEHYHDSESDSDRIRTVECPDNFCDVVECPEGTVCTTTDKNPTGYTCILVCDDETEVYNESYRTCECKEGYEKDQETQKCIEKTDNCKDVTCGENKVCKENSNVDAGYECVCDEENGYIADPSGEGCRLL